MRRPWMKNLQRGSMKLFPASRRAKAYANFTRQNAFARRNGVRILTGAYSIMIGIFLVETAYSVVINLDANGFFTMPENVAKRFR